MANSVKRSGSRHSVAVRQDSTFQHFEYERSTPSECGIVDENEPISIADLSLMSSDEKSELIRQRIPVMVNSLHDGDILSELVSYNPTGRYVFIPISMKQKGHRITFYG